MRGTSIGGTSRPGGLDPSLVPIQVVTPECVLLLSPLTHPPLLQLPASVPRGDINVWSVWVRTHRHAGIHMGP